MQLRYVQLDKSRQGRQPRSFDRSLFPRYTLDQKSAADEVVAVLPSF
jgi:hypothetical protein